MWWIHVLSFKIKFKRHRSWMWKCAKALGKNLLFPHLWVLHLGKCSLCCLWLSREKMHVCDLDVQFACCLLPLKQISCKFFWFFFFVFLNLFIFLSHCHINLGSTNSPVLTWTPTTFSTMKWNASNKATEPIVSGLLYYKDRYCL